MAQNRDRQRQDGDAAASNGAASNGTAETAIPRLKTRYFEEIRPALVNELKYGNVMQAPKLEKIVVNIGIGEAIANSKALDAATGDLQAITGQKPITKKAKKSIAQFRLREGMTVGIMPITGIPAPLLSYGGSSMLVTFLALGLLQSIAAQAKEAGALKTRMSV